MSRSSPTNFWLIEVSSDLSILRDYLDHIEEQVEEWHRSAEDILETCLQRLPSLSPNDRDAWSQFAHQFRDDYVECRLPRILYNPFLVAMYAVYESAVTEVAKIIQQKKGQDLSLDDIKGRDFLDRARKYYQHVLMFDLSKSNQSWERLRILAGIRHAIAHANGRLGLVKQSKREKIREWINQAIGIEEYYGDISVSGRFVRETFDVVKDCVEDLINRYNELDRPTRVPPQEINVDQAHATESRRAVPRIEPT